MQIFMKFSKLCKFSWFKFFMQIFLIQILYANFFKNMQIFLIQILYANFYLVFKNMQIYFWNWNFFTFFVFHSGFPIKLYMISYPVMSFAKYKSIAWLPTLADPKLKVTSWESKGKLLTLILHNNAAFKFRAIPIYPLLHT